MRFFNILSFVIVLAFSPLNSVAAPARSQEDRKDLALSPKIHAGYLLGIDSAGSLLNGAGLSAEGAIVRYFALGGAIGAYGLSMWPVSATIYYADLLLKPQYPIEVPYGQLAVYLNVTGGVSLMSVSVNLDAFGVGTATATATATGTGTGTAFGWNVGVSPGVQYYFLDGLGAFTEIGVINHGYGDLNIFVGQFRVGLSYAF